MADPGSPSRTRRARILAISAAFVVVSLGAVLGAVVVLSDGPDDAGSGTGTATLALARLEANDGRAYVGTLDDVTDQERLRRALRAEFRSDVARNNGAAPAPARRCASELQRTSAGSRGPIVLLADATVAGARAVVVGIAVEKRVVVVVADAGTCAIHTAQSL